MRIALDSISQKEIMQRAQNIVTRILNSKILNVVIYTLHCTRIKDGGSPDARLRLARLGLARLRLNDGVRLWISFKL